MREPYAIVRACAWSSLLPAGLLMGLLVPAPAAARVEVHQADSGRKVISNENDAQRARRLAPRLVEPPSTAILDLIDGQARAVDLDPVLVRALVQVESGYNPEALSNKGAMGLMQLMPETARDLAVASPFEPAANVRGGTAYLRSLLDRFGRVELALAAYNAGPAAVAQYGGIPPYPETVEYVRRILAMWRGDGAAALAAPVRAEAPARPVRWRRDGPRIHLTNVQ